MIKWEDVRLREGEDGRLAALRFRLRVQELQPRLGQSLDLNSRKTFSKSMWTSFAACAGLSHSHEVKSIYFVHPLISPAVLSLYLTE